jgi:hypothetical protein
MGYQPSIDTLSYSLGDFNYSGYEFANKRGLYKYLKHFLKIDEFRNQFINRFADQINTNI